MRLLTLALLAFAAAPFAQAGEISVSFSDDFAEQLEDDYGLKEGDYLTTRIEKDMTRALSKAGVSVERVDVTILDAKPTKPTFKQLGDRTGLSYRDSVSRGGMDLSAIAYDRGGNAIGELEYDWYAFDIRDAGPSTWYDAKRASSRFARRFTKVLVAN